MKQIKEEEDLEQKCLEELFHAIMKQQLWKGQQTWLASLIHPTASLESYLFA